MNFQFILRGLFCNKKIALFYATILIATFVLEFVFFTTSSRAVAALGSANIADIEPLLEIIALVSSVLLILRILNVLAIQMSSDSFQKHIVKCGLGIFCALNFEYLSLSNRSDKVTLFATSVSKGVGRGYVPFLSAFSALSAISGSLVGFYTSISNPIIVVIPFLILVLIYATSFTITKSPLSRLSRQSAIYVAKYQSHIDDFFSQQRLIRASKINASVVADSANSFHVVNRSDTYIKLLASLPKNIIESSLFIFGPLFIILFVSDTSSLKDLIALFGIAIPKALLPLQQIFNALAGSQGVSSIVVHLNQILSHHNNPHHQYVPFKYSASGGFKYFDSFQKQTASNSFRSLHLKKRRKINNSSRVASLSVQTKSLTINNFSLNDRLSHSIIYPDLDFYSGKIHTISGPSGIGKSSLLDVIAGVRTTVSGSIMIAGKLYDLSEKDFRCEDFCRLLADNAPILLSYQNPFLSYPRVHPDELCKNIISDVTSADLLKDLQIQDLDAFTYEDMSNGLTFNVHAYKKLSTGQKQRVGIFLMLYSKAPIMLFDEPTSNLQKEWSERIFFILKKYSCQDTIIIVSTHDKHLISLADVSYHFEIDQTH